jgi:hypothetical protein
LIRDKKPWSLVSAAALLLGFSSVFIGNYFQLKAVSAETFDGPARQASSQASQYQGYKRDFDQAKTNYATINDRAKRVIGSDRLQSRELWLRALQILSRAIPPRIEGEVRDVSGLTEVNVDAFRATFFPNLGEWFAKIDPGDQQTMSEKDRQQPVNGPGWVFQIRGYTFHNSVRLYVVDSILHNLQSEAMQNDGVSHAFLDDAPIKDDWTPSTAGTTLTFRDLGTKGKANRNEGFTSGSASGSAPRATSSKSEKDESEVPADVDSYLKESQDRNKQAGSQNKIKRTDFLIEFAWRPDYVPPPKAPEGEAGSAGAPGDPGALPGAPAPGGPGAPGVPMGDQ